MRLLLLSNSRDPEGNYLHHPRRELRDLLGEEVREVLFVPYAGVSMWDEYAERVGAAFAEIGYRVRSIHRTDDPARAVREAEAIAVGGGNTFHLLRELQRRELLAPLRERALAGTPYVGWSAGSVVACPTIATTNDMPIVWPTTLDALGLIPFQLNAHYNDFAPPGFQGETRAQRLEEYVEVNPGAVVLGLREGSMLGVRGETASPTVSLLGAPQDAPVFAHRRERRVVQPGDDLGFLMESTAALASS